MKNWATKGENLHTTPAFVHSKVNAKFSKVVDFFFLNDPLFLLKLPQSSNNQQFSRPSKTGFFPSKSFFVENFRNMEAKNGYFVKIVHKKSHVQIGQ